MRVAGQGEVSKRMSVQENVSVKKCVYKSMSLSALQRPVPDNQQPV